MNGMDVSCFTPPNLTSLADTECRCNAGHQIIDDSSCHPDLICCGVLRGTLLKPSRITGIFAERHLLSLENLNLNP
jgi:hypothetical protein